MGRGRMGWSRATSELHLFTTFFPESTNLQDALFVRGVLVREITRSIDGIDDRVVNILFQETDLFPIIRDTGVIEESIKMIEEFINSLSSLGKVFHLFASLLGSSMILEGRVQFLHKISPLAQRGIIQMVVSILLRPNSSRSLLHVGEGGQNLVIVIRNLVATMKNLHLV